MLTRSQAPLEPLLRRQRILAWSLSILILTLTVGFFAMMTLAAPLMAHIVLGRAVTLANVVAAAIILLFLAAIAVFGWHAGRIDELLRGQ